MADRPPIFDAEFQNRLRDLFEWRRDVRRFRSDPLPSGQVEHLIETACLSPSVGLSQPWRFVLVEDPIRRERVRANFEASNAAALSGYVGDRARLYARLKLAGLVDAPHQLAVFADRTAVEGHGLGRSTMPETVEFSVVAAIYTFMLAARAEGIGVGWISILDPTTLSRALDVPAAWSFIGYLCVGYAEADDDVPMLERAGWQHRLPPSSFIYRR
jgi:5,6-dimethylbenzimidazole synthase